VLLAALTQRTSLGAAFSFPQHIQPNMYYLIFPLFAVEKSNPETDSCNKTMPQILKKV
jgi:hypothetical protein